MKKIALILLIIGVIGTAITPVHACDPKVGDTALDLLENCGWPNVIQPFWEHKAIGIGIGGHQWTIYENSVKKEGWIYFDAGTSSIRYIVLKDGGIIEVR